MQTFLIGLGLVVAGLVGVFWGYRIFRILLPIYGGIAGFVLANGWLGESNPWLALLVGIVAAVILGALAYLYWSVLVWFGGVILGAAVGALIAAALNLWTWLAILLVVVLAGLLGYLVWKIRDEVVIIATVITGAGAVALGVGVWLGLHMGIGAEMEPNSTWLLILLAVIWIGLLIFGIRYQWARYRHLGWYGFGGRAQPAVAPKAEVSAAPLAAASTPPAAVPAAAATVAAAEVASRAGAPVEITAEAAGEAAEAVEGAAGELGAAAVAAATADQVLSPAVEPGEVVEGAAIEPAAAAEEVTVPAAIAAGEAAEDAHQAQVERGLADIEATFPLEEMAKFKESLEFVEGIGPVYAEKLRAIGVLTVLDLLRRGATRKGRVELAELSGITGKLILEWVNHADLYRIKGVGSEYADLLEAAGVDTVVELAQRNPAKLLPRVLEVNEAKHLVRRSPVQSQVDDWVAQAKKLPRMIQY